MLREREGALRRRLMEHWSGVMAWEVRRLERLSSETQTRFNHQAHILSGAEDREEDLRSQIMSLHGDLDKKGGRTEELEEMVNEMGRRERAIEEEVRDLDSAKARLEKERDGWAIERVSLLREKDRWAAEKVGYERDRLGWESERSRLNEEKDGIQRQRTLESSRSSERDRVMLERVRGGLGNILGRRSIGEAEMVDAVEEVRLLVDRRDRDVDNLREEMKEVNMGLEEEVRRLGQDRDVWKGRAEKSDQLGKAEVAALERRLRASAPSPRLSAALTRRRTVSRSPTSTSATNPSRRLYPLRVPPCLRRRSHLWRTSSTRSLVN